jgi:soluble lytic murein transglycosylase-like protein
MPKFPGYDQQTTLSNQGPMPRAQGQRIFSGVGEGLSAFANAGNDLIQAEVLKQRNHDETAVNDVTANNFGPAIRTMLYDPKEGFFAKQGKDALDAMEPTVKAVQDLRTKTRDTLQNDNQKKMYDSVTRRRLEAELDAVSRHATNQQKVWQETTSNAVIKDAGENAIVNFNDPLKVDGYLRSGLFEIQTFGRDNGQSPEVINSRARDFVRGARTAVAERMLVSDPLAAQDYIRTNEKDLAGPHFFALEHKVKSATDPIFAKRAAEAVIRGNGLPNLDAAIEVAGEPLINAIVQTESGGNPKAVSPKGALGVMQLMPDTARKVAGDLGVPFDRDKLLSDPKYNKALGTEYLRQMTSRYGGNQTLALAAYNAGPGRVDEWVQKFGDPSKGQISEADFVAKIPFKETREYVAGINAKAPQGAVTTASRDTRANLLTWVSNAERTAEQMRPSDPVFRDMVVAQVKGYVNTIVAGQEGVQRQAHGALVQAAMGPEPGKAPLTLDELLSSAPARQAWALADPNSQRGVLAMLEHNARAAQGRPIRSDPALVLNTFQQIHAPEGDPNKITSVTQLTPLFGKIGWEDYNRLKAEIETSQSVGGKNLQTDVQRARASAHQMLRGTVLGQVQPDQAAEAAYRWGFDLDSKIEKYRKEGKDPRTLLTPGHADYMLKPEIVSTYMQTPQQAVQRQAAAIAAPAVITTDAEWAALPSGAKFIRDGKQWTKK